jgi:hypothetical protein
MTTFKKAGQGIVGQGFTCLSTVAVGDQVCITGDNTVGYSATGTPIGEVVAKTVDGLHCTVEMRSAKLETYIAEGAIAAGALVKMGTARTKVRTATPGSTAADIPLYFGVALAGVADTATVTIVVL